MSELLHHWKLTHRPFEAPWDSRFFYESPQHNEALGRLLYLVQERSMNLGLLTGEIGCGKTLTRAILEQTATAQDLAIVSIENCGFTTEELLSLLLLKLSPSSDSTPIGKMALMERMARIIEEHAAKGLHVVILLDEAQDLPMTTLSELRWLTNFNGNGRSVITIALIGQPCLRTMIESTPSIDQRITLRYHLQPLTVDDVPRYLSHRLHVAGHRNGLLFEPGAATLLHSLTDGVPREINRLAKLSMEHAFAQRAQSISVNHINAIAHDLSRHKSFAKAA